MIFSLSVLHHRNVGWSHGTWWREAWTGYQCGWQNRLAHCPTSPQLPVSTHRGDGQPVVQRVANGNIAVIGHEHKESKLTNAKKEYRKIWAAHPVREMDLLPVREFTIDLGTTTEMLQRSMRDKLHIKKYIGEWRHGSVTMTAMVTRFPVREPW